MWLYVAMKYQLYSYTMLYPNNGRHSEWIVQYSFVILSNKALFFRIFWGANPIQFREVEVVAGQLSFQPSKEQSGSPEKDGEGEGSINQGTSRNK